MSHTVQKLRTEIGVEGYYTNHSLCCTCATGLYHKGADEQQIMSITSYCSSTAVGAYKKVSHHQQEQLSLILQSSDTIKTESFRQREPSTKHNDCIFRSSSRSKSQSHSVQL